MKARILILAALTATALTMRHRHLVVHEWGTFTSIAGEDGTALDWRPLAGTNDLPSFVHDYAAITNASGLRHGHCPKCDITAKIRMETPVLYFYTDRDMDVSVRVGFPKGQITEWYPSACTVGSSIDWGRFTVLPSAATNLLTEASPNHYYAARDTDAALVRVCNTNGHPTEFEKFLFYRGVGGFDLPMSVKLDGDFLRLAGLTDIAQVIVFENRGSNIGFRIVDVNSDEATVERPPLGDSLAPLLAGLQQTLITHGLYEREARAMLETWRDAWFEEGLRVFYVLPRKATDAALPLTIDPTPDELVRVLVGRVEVITPEMEARVLADPESYGRFGEPILKRVLSRRSTQS
jgi:hypothetical protein